MLKIILDLYSKKYFERKSEKIQKNEFSIGNKKNKIHQS